MKDQDGLPRSVCTDLYCRHQAAAKKIKEARAVGKETTAQRWSVIASRYYGKLAVEMEKLLQKNARGFLKKFPDIAEVCDLVGETQNTLADQIIEGTLGFDPDKGTLEAYVATIAWNKWKRMADKEKKRKTQEFAFPEGREIGVNEIQGEASMYWDYASPEERIIKQEFYKKLSLIDDEEIREFLQLIVDTGEWRPRYLGKLWKNSSAAEISNLKRRARRWIEKNLPEISGKSVSDAQVCV